MLLTVKESRPNCVIILVLDADPEVAEMQRTLYQKNSTLAHKRQEMKKLLDEMKLLNMEKATLATHLIAVCIQERNLMVT
jgi:septal ring factor EnvC (AmiA/AmiB activator)